MTEPSSSPTGSLNSVDYFKTLRGGAITFLSGIGVQLLIELQGVLEACVDPTQSCQFNFGAYDVAVPVAIAVIGMAIELIRRMKTSYSN